MVPPLITLEEHFMSEAMLSDRQGVYAQQFLHIPGLADKLRDVGPLRLQSMDTSRVSLQVVSHAPGTMTADQCRSANDQLAAAVKQVPDRFAAFAALPVADPKASADELTRCIKSLGFVGCLVDNHAHGVYFDGPAYHPFLQAAQDLDVPIYLHPTWPTDEMKSTLYTSPSISDAAATSLSSSSFGWHSDVALHVLRLFAAGVFDTFPRLKIIIGHMGEMLPFMLQRIIQLSPRWGTRQRTFKQVWDENVWITTSGVWSVDPMACILRNTKIERILYSVDYPFAKNEDGLKFMEDLEQSGLVSAEGLEKIAYRNAEALLGVKVKV